MLVEIVGASEERWQYHVTADAAFPGRTAAPLRSEVVASLAYRTFAAHNLRVVQQQNERRDHLLSPVPRKPIVPAVEAGRIEAQTGL